MKSAAENTEIELDDVELVEPEVVEILRPEVMDTVIETEPIKTI